MENKLREHIDKLKVSRLKESVDSELMKLRHQSDQPIDPNRQKQLKDQIHQHLKETIYNEYQYSVWIDNVLSQDLKGSYFPSNQNEDDLFQLLTLEVLYKRTFKSACDDGHPIITELLQDLNIEPDLIRKCIENARSFNPEPLAFYLLFQEELEGPKFRLDDVCKTIDRLSSESRHGAIVSHPAKMTNPECRFPKVLASSNSSSDGFIRTGNSDAAFDMHVNAVNLKVFKFISLVYRQQPLLKYIKDQNNRVFSQLFGVSEAVAKTWTTNFAKCLANEDNRTNQYIKQIYFPLLDVVDQTKYHLLSILTSSGLVFALKDKIDNINDRDPTAYLGKKLRQENKYSIEGFSTISNLTVTKCGGEHPKNISALNNKNQSYYLLESLPPTLTKLDVRFPKENFFRESFSIYEYRDVFYALHKLFKTDYNNVRIREGRDYRMQDLMDRIIDKMWAVRVASSEAKRLEQTQLKPHQKIWLFEEFRRIREGENEWLDKLCNEISRWIVLTYEKLLGNQAYMLGESERRHIHGIVLQNGEALR